MRAKKGKISLLIVLSTMLVISCSITTVAHPPHYDHDEAELNLSMVHASLNLTLSEMVSSLEYNLQVNYSQTYEVDKEGYGYGFMNGTYEYNKFELAFEKERIIRSDLSNVRRLIEEIDDDVPSHVYLRRYYLPFYDLSANLTSFSENHHSFLSNLTRSINTFNSISENETADLFHSDLMRGIDNSLVALERMEESLDRAEFDIVEIEERLGEDLFDFSELREKIDELRDLIEEYREYLSLFIDLQEKLPAFLTARAPRTVHPGQRIKVEGVYVGGFLFELDAQDHELEEGPISEDLKDTFIEKGRPIENASIREQEEDLIWLIELEGRRTYRIERKSLLEMDTLYVYFDDEFRTTERITIYLNGKEIGHNESRADNYYRSQVKIPWDLFSEDGDWQLNPGDELELKAVSDEQNITSPVENVTVRKWPAEIGLSLEEEKRGYFDENVSIKGEFITDAPVGFDTFNLTVSPITPINKDVDNFTFHMSLHTRELDWGENEVDVTYQGNETMVGASEQIVFEKSIPTLLTIESNKEDEDLEYLEIEGQLLNASSQLEEGLESKEVVLKVDGEIWDDFTTHGEGKYNFSINVDSLQGRQELYVYFEGDLIFRESSSEVLRISEDVIHGEDDEDDEDDDGLIDGIVQMIIDNFGIFLLLCMIIIIGLVIFFFHWKKKRPSSATEEAQIYSSEGTPEGVEEPVQRKKVPSLQATSEREISSMYGELLRRLYADNILSVEKGKTHRELERELISRTSLKEDISNITLIFEKALFSDQLVSSSDLQVFNSSLKEVEEELL